MFNPFWKLFCLLLLFIVNTYLILLFVRRDIMRDEMRRVSRRVLLHEAVHLLTGPIVYADVTVSFTPSAPLDGGGGG